MTVGTHDWAINLELTLALMPPSVGALVEASLRRPICLGAHGNLTAVSAETWTSPSSFSLECFLGTLTGNHVSPRPISNMTVQGEKEAERASDTVTP